MFEGTQKNKQADRDKIDCLISRYWIYYGGDQEYMKVIILDTGFVQNAISKYV